MQIPPLSPESLPFLSFSPPWAVTPGNCSPQAVTHQARERPELVSAGLKPDSFVARFQLH